MSNHPFIAAAVSNNIPELQSQINTGIDIDTKNSNGQTALMLAAYKGNIAVVEFLLDNNADPNIKDKDNWTALRYAEEFGKTDVIELLRDLTLIEKSTSPVLSSQSSSTYPSYSNDKSHSTNNLIKNILLIFIAVTILALFGFKIMPEIIQQSSKAKYIKTYKSQNKERTDNKYNWKFPKSACGDRNSPGKQNFYPVYVNRIDSRTLNYINRRYCRDAYIITRKESGKRSIQVASFANKDKAFEFARILIRDPQINSGEVGTPSLR